MLAAIAAVRSCFQWLSHALKVTVPSPSLCLPVFQLSHSFCFLFHSVCWVLEGLVKRSCLGWALICHSEYFEQPRVTGFTAVHCVGHDKVSIRSTFQNNYCSIGLMVTIKHFLVYCKAELLCFHMIDCELGLSTGALPQTRERHITYRETGMPPGLRSL